MTAARIRQNFLLLAEAFDAWRVVVHLMMMAYGYLVLNLYIWYKNIPTYVQEKCDSAVISVMLEKGKNMNEIKQYACTVVDVVGGPTAAQSTFVTTIIGLSAGIFGLYTTTGRKWDHWEPSYSPDSYVPAKTKAVVSYAPSMPVVAEEEVVPEDPSSKTINIYAADEKTPDGPKP